MSTFRHPTAPAAPEALATLARSNILIALLLDAEVDCLLRIVDTIAHLCGTPATLIITTGTALLRLRHGLGLPLERHGVDYFVPRPVKLHTIIGTTSLRRAPACDATVEALDHGTVEDVWLGSAHEVEIFLSDELGSDQHLLEVLHPSLKSLEIDWLVLLTAKNKLSERVGDEVVLDELMLGVDGLELVKLLGEVLRFIVEDVVGEGLLHYKRRGKCD